MLRVCQPQAAHTRGQRCLGLVCCTIKDSMYICIAAAFLLFPRHACHSQLAHPCNCAATWPIQRSAGLAAQRIASGGAAALQSIVCRMQALYVPCIQQEIRPPTRVPVLVSSRYGLNYNAPPPALIPTFRVYSPCICRTPPPAYQHGAGCLSALPEGRACQPARCSPRCSRCSHISRGQVQQERHHCVPLHPFSRLQQAWR